MSLQKNGPALIPRAPLRRPKMGDVLVAHWWTKVFWRKDALEQPGLLAFLHAKDAFCRTFLLKYRPSRRILWEIY